MVGEDTARLHATLCDKWKVCPTIMALLLLLLLLPPSLNELHLYFQLLFLQLHLSTHWLLLPQLHVCRVLIRSIVCKNRSTTAHWPYV